MTIRTSAKRLIEGSSFIVGLLMRKPRVGHNMLNAVGAMILDARFDERSPIPTLPGSLAASMGDCAVTLPPRSLLDVGNQDLNGLTHLASLAIALDARTVFEIGTYNGVTALTLAVNAPEATIHTLDLAPDQHPVLPIFEQDNAHLNVRGQRKRHYEGRPEATRIVQHFGDSARFDFSNWRGAIDLVYVDGAHSLEYVTRDTQTAFELVSPRGAIVWDDYWRRVPDVPLFLDTQAKRGLYRLPGSRLVAWFSGGAASTLEARPTLGRLESAS